MTTPSSWSLAMTQDTLWGLVDRNPTLLLGHHHSQTCADILTLGLIGGFSLQRLSLRKTWAGGPLVHGASPQESRVRIQIPLLGPVFQGERIVNPDTIPFFPQEPSLLVLLVQIELDNFLGISQVAQRFPSTFL
ncbi:hypothetical protein DSO57_1039276 [Entomophthora muscae]|uniref:Uncharacterized protein n=1 Tax=Entomophthora muscae TaxID=34485 RepID=A0ACC2TL71_9FUNG|nr:hypothetical protein DSO57_1039276 [Entomophthora muscae]